ncbi:retrovirus-related pol polyprotein from transposon TNT 1-94 [Tanacetum coccineum]
MDSTITTLMTVNTTLGLPKEVTQKDMAQSTAIESLSPGWLMKMENLNEVRVKKLRSDNGTEFKNNKLEEFCDEKDHLGKFDEKDDNGFFLGYSLVAKAFRVFNIRRQEMEEIYHVTFSEDDEAISQSSTEGDAINLNETRSFPDDEFLEARSKAIQCFGNIEYFSYIPAYDPLLTINTTFPKNNITSTNSPILHDYNVTNEPISDVQPLLIISPLTEGKPLAGITTKSRVRDSEATSAYECLYVNFLSKMEPKKLIKDLEEEGWIIAMQEELNQFERNKKILEDVYVQQPLGFESSEFSNHVCKLDKALYGLKQAPERDLLKKYDLADSTLVKYPMLPPNNLNPDESGVSVNEMLFRDMIGSLMYLIASRLDIQFSTCLCARYQANPKESHLVATTLDVTWIYLKAYFDSEYIRGCQILGRKLVCWSTKKQSSMEMSSAEAEYVPIFCDNTSAIAISNNPVLHSRTKHIDIRYHFIRDNILKGDIELHFVPTDLQLADIFTKPLAEPSFTRLVIELAEADTAMKSITFTFSHFDKLLLFDLDVFSTVIGIERSKEFVLTPLKEIVKAGLESLGLTDEKDTSLSSFDLIYSSPMKIKYFSPKWRLHLVAGKKERKSNICYTRYLSLIMEHLMGEAYINENLKTLKHHYITATTFKPTLKNETSLTAHMCKVAKLSPNPIKSLLSPFGEVNADNSSDKSSSKTFVQLGCTSMPEDDLASLSGFETPDSNEATADNILETSVSGANNTLNTSAVMPAQSDPLGHLQEELRILNTKVDQLESSIFKKVTNNIQSSIPLLVVDTLKAHLLGLLSGALKNTLPQMLKDSIKQSVLESIKEKLSLFDEQV